MCGRYALTSPGELLAKELALDVTPRLEPRYNIAPTQAALIIRKRKADEGREAAMARWGFRTGHRSGSERLLINARSETAAQKPSFQKSFAKSRCLVPATGFYEWQGARRQRQPFYFELVDARPMAFAGLWENTFADNLEPELVFTILTTEANELVGAIHDRMPVILRREAFDAWLSTETRSDELESLLSPLAATTMTCRPVSNAVNDVRNDSPACLEAPRAQQLELLTGAKDMSYD